MLKMTLPVGTPLQMRQTFGYCASMVGIALAFGIAGPSLPILARLTGHSYSVVSTILIARGIGDVCGMLLVPYLFGKSRQWFGEANGPHIFLTFVMLSLAAYSALTALVAPLTKSIVVVAFLQMASSASNGQIDSGFNVLLPWVWEPEKLGFWMNLMHCIWGIGAGLAPLLVDLSFLIGSNDASYVLWSQVITALLQLGLSFWVFTVPAPSTPGQRPKSIDIPLRQVSADESTSRLLDDTDDNDAEATTPGANNHDNDADSSDENTDSLDLVDEAEILAESGWRATISKHRSNIVLFGLSFFLGVYIGFELGIAAWITTYALELGFPQELATSLGTVFWWSLTGGRVAATLLSIYFTPRTLLLGDVVLCFVGILLLRLFTSEPMVIFTTAFLGVACASIFPNTVALPPTLGFELQESSMTIIIAGASIGNLILPPSIGLLFDFFDTSVLPIFLFFTLSLATLILLVVLLVVHTWPLKTPSSVTSPDKNLIVP